MSTRSRIGYENGRGLVTSVYCHFDGYPEGVGAVLSKHYNTDDKVRELLVLGDISSLGESIDTSVFYARDRGEDLADMQINPIKEFKTMDVGDEEFIYLFGYKEKIWRYTRATQPRRWKKLQ